MALEEWKLRLTSAKVEVEDELGNTIHCIQRHHKLPQLLTTIFIAVSSYEDSGQPQCGILVELRTKHLQAKTFLFSIIIEEGGVNFLWEGG